MPTTAAEIRNEGKRLFAEGEHERAESLFRQGHDTWPGRLDLAVWLARSLGEQGRNDERRSLLDEVVAACDPQALPPWGPRVLADEGYLIHRGVRLCLDHPAISSWMRQRMRQGDYEEIEADLVASVVRPGDRILEVGGGLGFMAAFAALQAPDVTSVVYEANPGLVPVAEHTKRLNGVAFDYRNAMLGAAAGSAVFHVHEAFWASSATDASDDSTPIDVPVHAVGDVLAEHEFTMLVMDIEGGEIELIPEIDMSTIDRIVVETHPAVTGDRAVAKMLRNLRRRFGFGVDQHREDVYLLRSAR